jgi:hypothetical protein
LSRPTDALLSTGRRRGRCILFLIAVFFLGAQVTLLGKFRSSNVSRGRLLRLSRLT